MIAEYAAPFAVAAAGFAIACGLWSWRTWPRWLSRTSARPGVALALIAMAGATAAVVPGPALTGNTALDVVARVVVVVTVGVAGMASPGILLAAGFAVLALPRGGEAGVMAAAAAGVFAMCAVPRVRISPLAGAGGALLVVAMASVPVPAGHPGGAVTPLLAVGLVVVGGAVGLSTRAPRRTMALIGSLVGVVAIVGGLGGLAVARSKADLEAGLRLAQASVSDARSGRVIAARQELGTSRSRLEDGRRRLRVWWARPALAVPVEAANLRAVDALATAGIDLTTAGSNVVAALAGQDLKLVDGRVPIQSIQAIDQPLADAEGELDRTLAGLDHVRSPWLVPPVTNRLTVMRSKVAEVARIVKASVDGERLAVSMLGGGSATPRRYFLALTTPSELRGATGLIANYGILVADQGKLALTHFGRMEDLARQGPKGPEGLGWDPQFVSTYAPDLTGALWQNLTISPDFPTTANAIESLYPRSGGESVDGVVVVDPAGLSALLAVEGPVAVSSWPTAVTSKNIVGILEHDQYNQFPDVNRRVDFLAELTADVINRINTADVADLSKVIAAFGPTVRGKHILLASTDSREQASLVGLGVGGALTPGSNDFLGVFSTNASTNKVDWYLQRSIDYRVALASGALRASLTIDLHNGAPSSGQAAYILQGTPGGPPPGTNRQILSLLTPWDVLDVSVDGRPAALHEAPWHGMKLFSVLVDIAPGADKVVQLRLGGPDRSAAYHLDVLAQPTSRPDLLHVLVTGRGRRPFERSVAVTSNVRLDGGTR
jgi:hypothetical protein